MDFACPNCGAQCLVSYVTPALNKRVLVEHPGMPDFLAPPDDWRSLYQERLVDLIGEECLKASLRTAAQGLRAHSRPKDPVYLGWFK